MNGKRLLGLLAVALLATLSLVFGKLANSRIREELLLARTPMSWVAAILPGPAAVTGRVELLEHELTGPLSQATCVYYRKLVERRTKDSDGDEHWETVEDVQRVVNFAVRDRSGQLPLNPSGAEIRAPQVHHHTAGDMRYTEYAIRPGNEVFVFGTSDGKTVGAAAGRLFLVSALGESDFRTGRGVLALILCVLAIASATFLIFFICYVLRQHHVFTYLTLMSLSVPTWLFIQWFSLTSAELRFGHEALETARQYLDGQEADSLEAALLKQTYNDGVERYAAYRARLPNRVVAAAVGATALDPVPVSAAEAEMAEGFPRPPRPRVALAAWAGVVFGLGGLAALIGCTWHGFRHLKVKRLVENLPTSPAAGVVYGLTELTGRPVKDGHWLTSRYTHSPCPWFRYHEKERRGSGKNARWVTIESGTHGVPFWLQDESGSIRVFPTGAQITPRKVLNQRIGKRLKEEWLVNEQDSLYVLGPARLMDADDDFLSVAKNDDEPVYLLSVKSEDDVKLGFAWSGFLTTNLALNGGTLAVLCLFSLRGFSPFDFFLSGLFPPLYLAFLVVFFLYNDLIYLRERARRALSMIDVALKKRADLVPNLVQVVQAYLGHERQLQEELAAMRSRAPADVQGMEELYLLQQAGLGHFLGVVEKHPELKGNQLTVDLQHRLSQLENEIGFMRQSYNDAVERYNSRIAALPEIALARLAGMQPFAYFEPEAAARSPQPVVV